MVVSEGEKVLLIESKFLCSSHGAGRNLIYSLEMCRGESCMKNVFESLACCFEVSVAMTVRKSKLIP